MLWSPRATVTEAYAPRACALQQEKPRQWEAWALQLERSPPLSATRESPHAMKIQHSQKEKKKKKKKQKTPWELYVFIALVAFLFFPALWTKGPHFHFVLGLTNYVQPWVHLPRYIAREHWVMHSWITAAELCRCQSQKQRCAGLAFNNQHGNSAPVCAQWHNTEICRVVVLTSQKWTDPSYQGSFCPRELNFHEHTTGQRPTSSTSSWNQRGCDCLKSHHS